MRENIEFNADGVMLRGWLYRPANGGPPYPAVVMAHGFAALKEMGLDRYAERFVQSGVACLVYDNRNLGDSDGEPRQDIDPIAQMRDYRCAVSFLQTRIEIDSLRIGLWGTSYTGGLVLMAAATDRRVRCVVAQVPYIHGLATAELTNSAESLAAALDLIDEERARSAAGDEPRTKPVIEYDPQNSPDSPGNRTYAFFHAFGDSPPWPNEITIRSTERRLEYDARGSAEFVTVPTLMIVASDDAITPTELALDAFQRIPAEKHLHTIQGDHYRPYLEAFDDSANAAADWFAHHLTAR